MKKLCYLIAAAAVCLSSCENEDKPAAAEKTLLETIATGQWSTGSYFIRTVDGEQQIDKVSIVRLKAGTGELPIGGFVALYYDLIAFCYSPDAKIDAFDVSMSDGPSAEVLLVRRGVYDLDYNPDTKIARMTPNDRDFAEKGFYVGVDMHLRTLTPDRIEFDMDINENTRREWAKYIDENTTGIRAVWTPADEKTRETFYNFESPLEVPLSPIK